MRAVRGARADRRDGGRLVILSRAVPSVQLPSVQLLLDQPPAPVIVRRPSVAAGPGLMGELYRCSACVRPTIAYVVCGLTCIPVLVFARSAAPRRCRLQVNKSTDVVRVRLGRPRLLHETLQVLQLHRRSQLPQARRFLVVSISLYLRLDKSARPRQTTAICGGGTFEEMRITEKRRGSRTRRMRRMGDLVHPEASRGNAPHAAC